MNTSPPSETNPGLTGGSFIKLIDQYGDLFTKHENYDGGSDYNHNFTENILKATSIILQSDVGWNEIHSEVLRFTTSSEVLISIDNLGYIFGKAEHKIKQSCPEYANKFTSDQISLDVRTLPSVINGGVNACFSFESDNTHGTICLPETSDVFLNPDCLVYVATAFAVDAQKSGIFPTTMGAMVEETDLSLSNNLLGLTIENGNVEIDMVGKDEPIVLTFLHDKLMVTNENC